MLFKGDILLKGQFYKKNILL